MKNKVIKVISLLAAIATLLSFAACGGDNGDETTTTTTTTTAAGEDVVATEAVTDDNGEVVTDANGEEVTVTVEDESSENDSTTKADDKTTTKNDKTTKPSTSNNNKTTKPNTSNNNKTTKPNTSNNNKTTKPSTTKTTTTANKTYTKAEIVKICSDAINKAKNDSPGYTKIKYQKLEGDRSAVPKVYNSLFGLFEEDSTKTYKPGKADKTNFGTNGYIQTKVSDPETITMDIKNNKYIINYTFGKETNPADLNSRYGRSMDIMTPDEVKSKSLGLLKDVTMYYYGGFLKAEVDIKTGRLTYLQMGSHVDVDVKGSNPFTVKDIVSRATYTDFVW